MLHITQLHALARGWAACLYNGLRLQGDDSEAASKLLRLTRSLDGGLQSIKIVVPIRAMTARPRV